MSLGTASRFYRQTYAEIDTAKIVANYKTMGSLLPRDAFTCPMVKGDAYGHGAVEVSRALRDAGARNLGVALIEEAIELRNAGDRGSILVYGFFEGSDADAFLEYELTPVISDWNQLESLRSAVVRRTGNSGGSAPCGLPIHLKFNTGMNRLGFDVRDATKIRAWLDSHHEVRLVGVCTHLLRGADAGIPGGESESQFSAFAHVLNSFSSMSLSVHVLNSSGTANLWKRAAQSADLGHGGLWPVGSRPGIALYGVSPVNDSGVKLSVVAAMTLKSHLVRVHSLAPGERVSYDATWRAKRDSVIGVVSIGYGDGYFRQLSNKGFVLCRGHRVPVIGTICMDYLMIDLTEIQSQGKVVHVGEEVVLIGRQDEAEITASELAELIGTIPYEVMTHLGSRVPRVYTQRGEAK